MDDRFDDGDAVSVGWTLVDEASATSKKSSDWNESIGIVWVASKIGRLLEGEGIAANNKYSKDG